MALLFNRYGWLLAAFLISTRAFAGDETTIASPDGAIEFKVFLSDSLRYEVTFKDQPVIERSPLSFTLDGVELAVKAEAGDIKTYRHHETYPWRGMHSLATNHCHGAIIPLKRSGVAYTLEVRAFNDGVAYRFTVPGRQNRARVPDENSKFILPAGSRVWYHDFNGHYEGIHTSSPVAEVPAGQWIAPPMTFKLPNGLGYASITEAALMKYSGLGLKADGDRSFVVGLAHKQPPSHPFVLRYTTNDIARLSEPASVTGPIATPWRVVLIGANLNTLVNSDVLPNLCPPPDTDYFPNGIRTDWVKPGRAVWKYLDGGTNTIEGTREFCRIAGQLGFEYNVIEGYWGRWSDAELKDLVVYARKQGVGLFVWKHSRGLRTPEEREEFFQKLHDLGIVGAKVDFFDHEHKEVVDLYDALLESAAKHKVLLNFHGANKPTGTVRTWPNELTREGIKGMESRRVEDRATHDVTLPFTRLLAGPGDYTPVHFNEQRRRNTTWTHQVATAAIFNMPLLTYAANPFTIQTNAAVDLIKQIPAVWDETIVLPPSEIGELAVFARRIGDAWFLAVLNGPEGRAIHVPLSFLGTAEYQATLLRDAVEPDSEQIENRTARRGDSLAINLRPGGGFIGRFTKR